MKKLILFVILFLNTAIFAKINLGISPGLAHSSFGLGFGGTVSISANVTEKVRLGGSVGYYWVGTFDPMHKNDIFLQGLTELYLLKNKKIMPFIGLAAGFHLFQNSITIGELPSEFDSTSQSFSSISATFTKIYFLVGISPNIGIDYNLNNKIALRIKYTYSLLFTPSRRNNTFYVGNANTTSSVLQEHYGTLNLGVVFKLGK